MKPRCSKKRDLGFTLVELLLIAFLITVLAAMFLPALGGSKRHHSRISCVNNLKEMSLAFRIWEGDNNDFYPMAASCTNGGAMEQTSTGDVVAVFQIMQGGFGDHLHFSRQSLWTWRQ